MSVQITVRGSAEARHPAERATLELTVAVEGSHKEGVLAEAIDVQEQVTGQLRTLAGHGAVTTWSSDQLQIFTRRLWEGGDEPRTPVHIARLHVSAEFGDFEHLNGFVEHWSGRAGVEVKGVAWDVMAENRRRYEAEVRMAAVDDAVVKAQAYADALRRGPVAAVALSDAGMLEGVPGAQPPVPMARLASASSDTSSPSLTLEPEEILVRVEVDARFRAD